MLLGCMVSYETWQQKKAAELMTQEFVHHSDGDYDTEFTVLADGYRMRLVDPYGTPKLHIRGPGSAKDGKRSAMPGSSWW